MKKIFLILLMLSFLVPTTLLFAQSTDFIPCGGYDSAGRPERECGYYDLLEMVNRIINWIILISAPVAAGVIAWAGFTYMTTGISDQKSAAKKMIMSVLKGFFFILAAWLLVSTLLDALLADSFKNAVPLNLK